MTKAFSNANINGAAAAALLAFAAFGFLFVVSASIATIVFLGRINGTLRQRGHSLCLNLRRESSDVFGGYHRWLHLCAGHVGYRHNGLISKITKIIPNIVPEYDQKIINYFVVKLFLDTRLFLGQSPNRRGALICTSVRPL
jgi:hypothetical protein